MSIYEDLKNKKKKLALVGLGYVGMPIAVAFAKKVDVIGFDINQEKIELYKQGFDPTNEVGNENIKNSKVFFTADENYLKEASFFIVAVPTPVAEDHSPDLTPVISATALLGRNIPKGSIVVYESTVYPGVTEEVCVPILERESGLKCGKDFFVGYSPERINPGDKKHRLENIIKIVSGMNVETLEEVANTYGLVVEAGVYRAESIKVAEAAKVIENSQRDINIAFMNELSIIFDRLGIDTKAVLKAAGTKWNFLNFEPGLVGGHCIGVDPYYLTYKAEKEGYHSQIILSGRKINDDMGKYIAQTTVKKMIQNNVNVREAKVAVFGITFKENCPDTRNSKVIDILKELKEYHINPIVVDPVADKKEAKMLYDLSLNSQADVKDIDTLIIATGHEEFKNKRLEDYIKLFGGKKPMIIDVKGILDKQECEAKNISYWRL